jgi:hypothetical protein
MRNSLDKSWENQITRFMLNTFFSPPKIVPFVRYCRKIWWSQRSHKSWHNMVYTRCMLDNLGYTWAWTHAFARTHRKIFNTFCCFTATMISLMLLNVTLYVNSVFISLPSYTCPVVGPLNNRNMQLDFYLNINIRCDPRKYNFFIVFKPLMHSSLFSHVSHIPSSTACSLLSPEWYLVSSTGHEADVARCSLHPGACSASAQLAQQSFSHSSQTNS